MTRARVPRPAEGRVKVLLTLEAPLVTELDRLADEAGRDRSHHVEELVRAEVKRRARRTA